MLFAIDFSTEEVIVSNSSRVNDTVHFVERVSRVENEIFFQAVVTLTIISKSPQFDRELFKAMDKVCTMIYIKYKGN
jgi:hypothetical protein